MKKNNFKQAFAENAQRAEPWVCRVHRTAITLMLLSMPVSPLLAQSRSAPTPGAEEKTLQLRLVTLGHRRLAEFTTPSTEAQIPIHENEEGAALREFIPGGIPIEIQGKLFEYLPSAVFIEEPSPNRQIRHVIAPLILNAASPMRELSHRSEVNLLIRQPREQDDEGPTFRTYASAPVAEEQSHMVFALINRYSEHEGWKEPLVRTFDVSPNRLPGGSILFFNGTPLALEIDILKGQHVETITIPSMESKVYNPYTDAQDRSHLRAKIVGRNAAKKQIFFNSLRVDPSGRTFFFAYLDPLRIDTNPAGIVQFHDVLPEEPPE